MSIGLDSSASMGSVKAARQAGEILNNASIKKGTNMSIGDRSIANMGSVIGHADKGSRISNSTKINDSTNMSIGAGSSANMGSVAGYAATTQRHRSRRNAGTVGGKGSEITNISKINKSTNMSIGISTQANMGSVVGGTRGGKIVNNLDANKATNMAIGIGSDANMGTVVLQSSRKVNVSNSSKIDDSTNMSIGINSTANMGTVTVE